MISIKLEESIENLIEHTGELPFQSLWYQKTFVKHFCKRENLINLSFYNDGTYVGYGIFERLDNKVVLLGMKPVENGQEVTDYGDIYVSDEGKIHHREIWRKLIHWFQENKIELLQLDYVREDALTFNLFKDKAVQATVAPYIVLPISWDEYLDSLDRVDRKELKRKIRRLETVSYNLTCIEQPSMNNFEEFIRLHKLSSGKKNEFMTETMKNFFWDLASTEQKDWKTTISFLKIENKNVSAVMSFENGSSILAYNSGYDPSMNYYSVGLLLHAFKIKEAIAKGKTSYDFLRGTERYKYDLGGNDIRLFKIEIPLSRTTMAENLKQ
jgi:hypothetical protein